MSRIVTYIAYPSQQDVYRFNRLFGEGQTLDPVLPHVSPPISPACAMRVASELSDLGISMIQPEDDQVERVSAAAALRTLRASDEWKQMLADFATDDGNVILQTKNTARCWLVLARTAESAGLAPGIGFVIDKHSEYVFSRRYIDVHDHFAGT